MAGAQFEYDEKGTTFYYFVLCFFAILLLPLTYFAWVFNSDEDTARESSKVCNCPKCFEKRQKKLKLKPKNTMLRIASRISVVLLWIVLLYGVYRVSQFEKEFIEYDPFAVLEIDKGASAAEIKRQYRKLSLVYHPDKETGDEKKFMRIAKAYEALTNEESRKNWEEHGNPDGPQATTFGIALPSWIVSEENSIWVLGAYIFAFMVVLPTVVGTWWYRSIKYGCDQVLMDTTKIFFHFFQKTPCMQVKRVIMVFSGSMEFERKCNQEVQERPSDNIELPKLLHELQTVNESTKEAPFGFPFSVKCRALIMAHMERLTIPEDTLQIDLELILKKAPLLIQEMVNVLSQLYYYSKADNGFRGPRLDTFESVMKLSQMLVQALRESKSPLLQLPHISPEHLRYFTTKKRNIKSIKNLIEMKKIDRRDMLRFLTDEQYDDVMLVAGMIPHITMNVKPHVMDDEDEGVITAGAVVTVAVELNRNTLQEVCADGADEEEEHIETIEPAPESENVEEAKAIAKNNKVWQKTKRKGKKAKPVKQQPKRRPTKQASKQKDEGEAKDEEKENEADDEKDKGKEKEKGDSKRKDRLKKESLKKQEKDKDEDHDDEDENSEDEEKGYSDSENLSESDNGSDGSAVDAVDDDDDEWHRMQEGVDKIEKVLDTKSRSSHDVHAPFFPEDKQEWWWVYICDRKKQEIVTIPTQVVNLKDNETVKLQFQAPSKCGHYSYTAIVRSDSYMDVDVIQPFKIEVHEAKEIETKQWDFDTDEEEDKDNESGESEWDEEEESD